MTETTIGRNEPCPCGSKKKYKRCCGVAAAPKITPPKNAGGMPGGLPGNLPENFKDQFDPAMMSQFSQMLGRLPKGQLQKLQGIMQKAMSGKDVTREAKEFEQSLPVELQSLLSAFQMPGQMPGGMPGMGGMPGLGALAGMGDAIADDSAIEAGMSEEEARKIVENAVKEGKISGDQATELLKETPASSAGSKGGFSKLWKKMSGK
jgi:hypothetical protein